MSSIRTRWPLSGMQKITSLGLLYFVQGLPYGFQDKLVPLVLIARGHSASSVALTRLLLLPWLAKPLLAPLIDTMLTKAKWVQMSLLALTIISLLNAAAEPESDEATTISPQLSFTLFMLNLCSAVQDIAVDAIAIAVLSCGGEIASGNAAQVVGYKIGAFTGSAVLFWIYASFGWNGLFLFLSALYATVLLVFLFTISPPLVESKNSQSQSLGQVWTQVKGFSRKLQLTPSFSDISPSLRSLLFYLVLYKLGESAALATFPFFLARSGVASGQIAFWNGTLAMLSSIVGSTLASWMSVSHLEVAIKLRLLPLLLQLLLVGLSGTHLHEAYPLLFYCSVLSLVCLHFIGGIVTTLTFTLMMTTCQSMPDSFRATRYTLLSSVEVFGKLMFASLSGFCVDLIGFSGAHLVYLLLSVWPLLFLKVLLPSKDAAKPNQ